MRQTCSVAGCNRKAIARGLCDMHYRRMRQYGSTDSRRKTVEQRLMEKVRKDPGGCWLWTGVVVRRYGQIGVKGKGRRTHRVSYELFKGPIPEGLYVLHSCDNPLCVNPDHLFLGTNEDNMADMVKKGRAARMAGEKHGMSKLTAQDVTRILRDNRKQKEIAKDYAVTQSLISHVKCRKGWKHIHA